MDIKKKEQLKKILKSKNYADLPRDVKEVLIEDLMEESNNKFYVIMAVIAVIAVVTVIGLILYFTHSLSDAVIGSICVVVMVVVIVIVTRSVEGIAEIVKHMRNKP